MDMNEYLQRFLAETTEKVDEEIKQESLKAIADIGAPMFAMYVSFVDAGFTKFQALELVKTLLVAGINGVTKK